MVYCAELLRDGFGENPLFKVILVERTSASSTPANLTSSSSASASKERTVGYAMYYTYSSFQGRVLHLENIYIRPQYRGKDKLQWLVINYVL